MVNNKYGYKFDDISKISFFKPFQNKGNLNTEENYVVDAVMWQKFGNSSISMREVIITSHIKGFDHKNHLFWRSVLAQVQ